MLLLFFHIIITLRTPRHLRLFLLPQKILYELRHASEDQHKTVSDDRGNYRFPSCRGLFFIAPGEQNFIRAEKQEDDAERTGDGIQKTENFFKQTGNELFHKCLL